MIEVRADLDAIKKVEHEVTANIRLVEQLKAAGIPIVGKLVLSGVTHGTLVHHVEEDMDGDTLVYQWYDRDELKMLKFDPSKVRSTPIKSHLTAVEDDEL